MLAVLKKVFEIDNAHRAEENAGLPTANRKSWEKAVSDKRWGVVWLFGLL